MKTFKIPGLGNHLFEHEVLCAYYFANAAHAAVKQKRNYTDEPYIVHPVAVLALLMEYCPDIVTTQVACASLLHDTTEDTGVTSQLILQMFGFRVESMVKRLSKATTTSFGNRLERHEVELRRLATSTADVQSIKVADLINNYQSLQGRGTAFQLTFFQEGNQLVEAMKSADPRIVQVWKKLTLST